MKIYVVLSSLFVGIFLFAGVKPIFAQYGGNETPRCVVDDLKVKSMTNGTYFDNISANAYLFASGDLVEYKVTITNNTTKDQNAVGVSFKMPTCFELVFGPEQNSLKAGELKWKIDKLGVSEAKDFLIRAKLSDKCANGKQVANSEARCDNGQVDADGAEIYMGKKEIPNTGAEDALIKIILAVSVLGSGYTARRIARGY